jgi:beta-glucanase (GH16 family)
MQRRSERRVNHLGALGLAAIAVTCLAGFGRCGAPAWRLVWADEFDGAAGSPPDPASWAFDLGAGGWGNQELQTYQRDNAALDGQGDLVLTARAEAVGGSAFTSARVVTKGLREFTHGRVEARIKLPAGQGIWPAFWLLGADIDEHPWPACGEIDVLEARGQDPRVVVGSLHGPGYFGAGAITDAYTSAVRLDADFHVYAIEWDARFIAWEVDGVTYQVRTPEQLPKGATWAFDHPFYVLLNVAVGGTFVGAPDKSTVLPQAMVVDYVRVYEAG